MEMLPAFLSVSRKQTLQCAKTSLIYFCKQQCNKPKKANKANFKKNKYSFAIKMDMTSLPKPLTDNSERLWTSHSFIMTAFAGCHNSSLKATQSWWCGFYKVPSFYQCAALFPDLWGRSDNINPLNKSSTQEFHFSSSECLNIAFSFKFATIFIEIGGWGSRVGLLTGHFFRPASNTLVLVGIWLSDLDFPNLSVKPVWESNSNYSWVIRDS